MNVVFIVVIDNLLAFTDDWYSYFLKFLIEKQLNLLDFMTYFI